MRIIFSCISLVLPVKILACVSAIAKLGRNHQRGDFTFDSTGEVTNNVLGMYVNEYVPKGLHGSASCRAEEVTIVRKKSQGGERFFFMDCHAG